MNYHLVPRDTPQFKCLGFAPMQEIQAFQHQKTFIAPEVAKTHNIYFAYDFRQKLMPLFEAVKTAPAVKLCRWQLRFSLCHLDAHSHFPGKDPIPWWHLRDILLAHGGGVIPATPEGGVLYMGGNDALGRAQVFPVHVFYARLTLHYEWNVKILSLSDVGGQPCPMETIFLTQIPGKK